MIKSTCRFRLRTHLEAHANTSTFKDLTVSAKTNGFSVVASDPAVKEAFKLVATEINRRVPPLINGELSKLLGGQIQQFKNSAEGNLARELATDRILGPYKEYFSLKEFIP